MSRVLAVAFVLSSTLALAATGCETPAAANPAKPMQAANAPDDHALCVQLMDKSRECTAAFIPALVDARAAADQPPGIAAQVKADRDGVIAQANQEWANDSTDAAIDASCSKLPPLDADRDTAKSCLAAADCAGFVSCAMPVFAKHLSK
jgi:hypothetical protein